MRKATFVLILFICLLLVFPLATVLAATSTSGGSQTGIMVRETWKIHQNRYAIADDLHFFLWQKEDNVEINGWEVGISDFTNSGSFLWSQPAPWDSTIDNLPGLPPSSDPDNGNHAIVVNANGVNIPNSNWVTVNIKLWLTDDWNTRRISGAEWTNGGPVLTTEALPDHGWTIDWPSPDPSVNPWQYLHEFTITNDDTTSSLNVTGLAFLATTTWYADLTTVPFGSPYPDFSLAPGASRQIDITTPGSVGGGHIYFKYGVRDGGVPISEHWVDHPTIPAPPFPPSVGGTIVPVDRLGLAMRLAMPWIIAAAVIMVAGVSLAIWNKKRGTERVSGR